MSVIWINPVVQGSCDSQPCGGACCQFKNYRAGQLISKTWCEHFDQQNLKCQIYETRPEGCRRYPDVFSLTSFPTHSGCGYYLKELPK